MPCFVGGGNGVLLAGVSVRYGVTSRSRRTYFGCCFRSFDMESQTFDMGSKTRWRTSTRSWSLLCSGHTAGEGAVKAYLGPVFFLVCFLHRSKVKRVTCAIDNYRYVSANIA